MGQNFFFSAAIIATLERQCEVNDNKYKNTKLSTVQKSLFSRKKNLNLRFAFQDISRCTDRQSWKTKLLSSSHPRTLTTHTHSHSPSLTHTHTHARTHTRGCVWANGTTWRRTTESIAGFMTVAWQSESKDGRGIKVKYINVKTKQNVKKLSIFKGV